MFNYAPSIMNQPIPFSLPGASVSSTAIKSSFSLSTIFSGIQKTATTINQLVPLYHNVRPIISNSKAIFNIMKGVAAAPSKNNKEQKVEKEEIIDIKSEEKKDEEKIEIKSVYSPSKPYFN